MILQVSDFVETSDFYRIPPPKGAADTADVEGCIAEGQRQFCETFSIDPASIVGDSIEALKFFTFALWLRMQSLRRTAAGAGAKVNFTQSENHTDWTKRVQAYNRACTIMNQPHKKLLKILNY